MGGSLIFGIGTDILAIDRVERIYERHGERFAAHLLLPDELTLFRTQTRPARFLAMRFAAKEAMIKAENLKDYKLALEQCSMLRFAESRECASWNAMNLPSPLTTGFDAL